VCGEWEGFAHDPSHSGVAACASQPLNRVHWAVHLEGGRIGPAQRHYGSPAVTRTNMVLIPCRDSAGMSQIEIREGATGTIQDRIKSDYTVPLPGGFTFTVALSKSRGCFPAIGGSVDCIDLTRYRNAPNPHSFKATLNSVHSQREKLVFYGTTEYEAHRNQYDRAVVISTPITSDKAGNLFFGFEVLAALPHGPKSGIAKIDQAGHGTWVAAELAGAVTRVGRNCAPALSRDGKILYVTLSTAEIFGTGYLAAYDAGSLRLLSKVSLRDPRSGQPAIISAAATTSPTVGPDGDVYIGVLENPLSTNHNRGWLLHFDRNLTVSKTPGDSGWDITPTIVKTSLLGAYKGISSYVLMTKANDYVDAGGDGRNRLVLLDPNRVVSEAENGTLIMATVSEILAPTPNGGLRATYPSAVTDWCVNAAALDPVSKAILATNEDGRLYRWDFNNARFLDSISLTEGRIQAYTPNAIGPDGTAYAISNGVLFAVGQ
jgi:hypothetical protein